GTGTVHCTFKKLGRLGRDAASFARMLAAIRHPLLDQELDRARIDRQVAHRGGKEVLLFKSECVENMLDGDIVLVAFARFCESGLEDALPCFAKFIFVCVYVCHNSNCEPTFRCGAEGNALPTAMITF